MNKVRSISIIPDGNRRYSIKKKISLLKAYKRGIDKGISTVLYIYKKYPEVKQIQIYTLSIENLNRTKSELDKLMSIFTSNFSNIQKLYKENINIKFIGDLSKFTKDKRNKIKEIDNKNKKARLTFYICLGYGGRREIIETVNKIIKVKKNKIDEKTFRNYMYDKDLIDPDILIRTSGVNRLSGFLTYQTAYTELFFIKKLWPEITNSDIDKVIKKYRNIKRNFGK